MRASASLWMAAGVGLLLTGCAASQPVTTRSLLEEMTDLARLTEFPDPPYRCRQFSSHDRTADSPKNTKTWFANKDAGHFLRVEERNGRREHVMMDVDGPGAIVRIWSANPKGTLRVYLDHDPEPVIEAPMTEVLGGQLGGIPEPLAGMRGTGWNLYFPIPYARHCKVTGDEERFYYHVNYRTYRWGTRVDTFKRSDLERLVSEVGDVAARLRSPRGASPALTAQLTPGLERLENEAGVTIRPGESMPGPLRGEGEGAIVGLRVKVEAPDRELALRQLSLTMSFDGEQTVACPLGDFFGAGPGIHPYASLPLGVGEDGEMWCSWVMPYRKSVVVAIHNHGIEPARVRLSITTDTRHAWTSRSMHFHANWRVARDLPTRPIRDLNYADVRGQGVLVGTALAIVNPVKIWWGEGDEKIYVDGESFPSHFGTGTEDYFGYAWGNTEQFSHAYHSQPRCDGPGNYGRTAVNRWHIIDRIPFLRSLRFDMELWHWSEVRLPELSVVTYWYARPGASCACSPPSPRDLRIVNLPAYEAPRVAGALEGEEMEVLEQTGELGPQDIPRCSNDHQLWWRPGSVGGRLVLGFDAPATGHYRVFGRFVKAPDYAIVRLSLNGASRDEQLDLYAPRIAPSDEMLLGEFGLRAEDNRLAIEIVGANEEAGESYMFGLDYIRLEPLPEDGVGAE